MITLEKSHGRRVLVYTTYTTYTSIRNTTSRLKGLLEAEGLNAAVLRASVDTCKREDWICDQVEREVDVMITNPELVKTGLDLLDFPSIVFMHTYTLQQAARCSWRIVQTERVNLIWTVIILNNLSNWAVIFATNKLIFWQ